MMPALPPDRRTAAYRPDLADEALRGLVEAGRFVSGRPARIVAPSAPLRRAPSPDAPLETEALMGEAASVFDERDGYAWIQLASDGYVGYVPGSVLGEPGPEPTHRVSALRSFVYPAADMKTPPVAFLSLGATVAVDGAEKGGFLPIASAGFLFAAHLVPVSASAPDFVAIAEGLIGTPYLWGGKTTIGLDCSGLVQLSLACAGLPAPRDSDQQAVRLGSSRPVAMGERDLRRGDLVFWAGHVGIMQDGDTLLHANAHHMAVASEPLALAESRILRRSFGPVTTIRRPADECGPV